MAEPVAGPPREWRIEIAAVHPWLTANIERQRYGRAGLVKKWRAATVAACLKARLPKGVSPVTIHLIVEYAGARAPVRDKLNLAPTVKAIVDGLTPGRVIHRKDRLYSVEGYGLLPDDSDRHVLDTTWDLRRLTSIAHPRPGLLGLVRVFITDHSPERLFNIQPEGITT